MTIMSLWQPILVSAVLTFIAGAIIWMVMPWHKTDWNETPREEDVRAALFEVGVGTGHGFDHGLGEITQKVVLNAELAAIAHGTPDQTAGDVGLVEVAGGNAFGHGQPQRAHGLFRLLVDGCALRFGLSANFQHPYPPRKTGQP